MVQITLPALKSRIDKISSYIKKYWFLYMLALPGAAHMFIFYYIPMYGVTIAFKNFNYRLGILRSPWVGFTHFQRLIMDSDFFRAARNTLSINVLGLVFGFTFTILLALFLNEITVSKIRKTIQTVVYFPHFLSWVIFAGLVTMVLSPSDGIINRLFTWMGLDTIYFMAESKYFQFIAVFASIVKETGFGTIIYLAAIASVNPELYQSAIMDGAHRGHLIWHITLPYIKPTIAVLLILRVSTLFSSNFEQIWTLYNPTVYDTGDVISTYIYRIGLLNGEFELGSAMGLIFNVIGFILIFSTNKIIRKMDVMGIY